jgi:hypothetical protein
VPGVQSGPFVAVGSAFRPWSIATAGIYYDARCFGTDIKKVTVTQAGDADAGVDTNALDLLGHGLVPFTIAAINLR